MKKIISVLQIIVILLICAAFAGCNKTINDVLGAFTGGRSDAAEEELNAQRIEKETRYYNDYLGVSYEVPKGWWLYYLSEDNLSLSKGIISDDVSMDVDFGSFNDYKYSTIWFMGFGNLKKSDRSNHIGFDLNARTIEGISDMTGFMKFFEAIMEEPEENEEYHLKDSQQTIIKGKPFEMREYLVTREEYRDYYVLTLSCQLKQGYFLNIMTDYWADNTKAKKIIIESVGKAIEFY